MTLRQQDERTIRPSDFPSVSLYSCSRCLILAFTDGKHLCGNDTHYTGYDLKIVYTPDKVVRKS